MIDKTVRDPDLVNASKRPVTLRPGGSYFDHADSFAMIRGDHIDGMPFAELERLSGVPLRDEITTAIAR